MRLPSLSVIIVLHAIIWCVAGVWIHGPMILVYPLAWLAVISTFLIHNNLTSKRANQENDELGKPAWTNSVGAESKQAVA